MDLGQYKPLL